MTEKPAEPTPFDFEKVFEVDDYMYFYSDMLTEERTDVEVAALVRLLELDRPMKILDLACGFGRHTNRLAALGHQMTGVDLTPGFIELARQDAARRNVQVDYYQGDMRQIDYENEFDRVMLIFTAFGYFEDNENLLVVQKIAKALKPGGLLVFDSINRDTCLKGFLPFIVVEKGNDLMIDRNSLDSLTGRQYNRRFVIRNGIRKDKPFSVRLYNPNEIRDLLYKAGLELYQFYGGYDLQPVSQDARRLVVVARKPVSSTQ